MRISQVMNHVRKLWDSILTALVIVVLTVVAFWSTICRFGIDCQLNGYAAEVRRSNISLAEKERLLDLIEGLQGRLEQGGQIILVSWLKHDHTLRQILGDGIVGDEVRLIERELNRVEMEFEKSSPSSAVAE